jgi:hypothetical protein
MYRDIPHLLTGRAFAHLDIDDRNRRWSAEFSIPWTSLPDFEGPAPEGLTMRTNFYRCDRPADDEVRTVAWSPVHGGSFHQPDKFGQIRLVAASESRNRRDRIREGTGAGTGEESARGERSGSGEPRRLLEYEQIRINQPVLPRQLAPAGTGIQR